ncbi:MAG: TetR family transcriptional regulator [Pseudomonadota bacterium]
MVRRTKDEALATRSALLDTAERVFSERGVSHTSLADIARAAGVTRGAIYWHFKDKADLFCEMVGRVTLPMEDAPCQVNHGNAADPLASIRAMMIGILKRITNDEQARRVFHVVFHKCEYVDEMTAVWDRFTEMQVGCLKGIEQGLNAAVKRGQLPKHLDTRRAALGLHAMVDGLLSKWASDPDYTPPANEAERVVDLFLNGLHAAPASGAKRNLRKSATPASTRGGRRNAG